MEHSSSGHWDLQSTDILGEFLLSYGTGWMQIGPFRVGILNVQVVDGAGVTNERVSTRM